MINTKYESPLEMDKNEIKIVEKQITVMKISISITLKRKDVS